MALLSRLFITQFVLIRCSIRFDWFGVVCGRSRSFNQSIRLRQFIISSQTQLCSSITVHLSYISLLGSTVQLLHDFVFYCVLIVLPVKVAIDTLINETTPTAVSWEQSFRRDFVE